MCASDFDASARGPASVTPTPTPEEQRTGAALRAQAFLACGMRIRMLQTVKTLLAMVLGILGIASPAAGDDMKAFPPAGEGMARHVINLPPQRDEADRKLELLIGKVLEVDAHNTYFLGGNIEARDIPGWGFTRYVVEKIGPLAGTLMAVDPDAPKVARFIPLGGGPFLIRYNSRLPVVVYVPEGAEVRYRVWQPGDGMQTAPRG